MTAPAPSGVALTARFFITCGREVFLAEKGVPAPTWCYVIEEEDGSRVAAVPDLTREKNLGVLIKMWQDANPNGQWRLFGSPSLSDPPCHAAVWLDWGQAEKIDSDGEGFGDNPGAALMLAAIEAGGGEGGLPEQGG